MKDAKNKKIQADKLKAARKIGGICGFILLCVILFALLLNAMLCVFAKHYYPTFGRYRLFSIVSDSMEPEIPTGNMIVGRVPKSESEITVGTVITYEYTQGNSIVLITHRVVDIGVNENGETVYTTKGDNAAGRDAYRPVYSDVVGIYTGDRCGFFGYLFGFLQSSQGAIALIIISLIVALTAIIVHFVNLVNVWRTVALNALKKSGSILSDTHIEELGAIADVIGIVAKDPADKKEMERKDKKLNWFIKTGTLPKRPYSDDLEDDLKKMNNLTPSPLNLKVVKDDETAAEEPEVITERFEKMRYVYTFTARLIQLKPKSKEWYSRIKNELLSFNKVKSRVSARYETFTFGRKTPVRVIIKGKTLCLLFAADPAKYEGTKVAVEKVGESSFIYRIKSPRRVNYALEVIADIMKELGAEKLADYEPQDFYMPYEGTVSLISRGLVKRNITSKNKTYKIEEIQGEDTENTEITETADDEKETK